MTQLRCADGHAWEGEVYRITPSRCPEHRAEHRRIRALRRYYSTRPEPELRTLLCWAGHEWQQPKKRGTPPKACPEHSATRQRTVDAERSARYYAENRDSISSHGRAWRATPVGAEKVRAASSRRRARLRGAPEIDPTLTWRVVGDRDGMTCHYCGRVPQERASDWGLRPTLDHVVPLVRGGAHNLDNAVLACQSCNSRKGSS